MYSASNAFHQAVANNAHQIAMLIFDDTVFTNEDINVTKGIEFNDYFNTEEDLSIGKALSNEISFSLFNDDRLLNDYAFGLFTATIGVQISDELFVTHSSIYVESESNVYTATMQRPFIKRNGTALGTQPNNPLKSILIYNGKVYCFDTYGGYIVYNDADGTVANVTVNQFMLNKASGWEYVGLYYNASTRILKRYEGPRIQTYEFVPLGRFMAERPNVPNVIEINFTCYDRMQEFEKDMPDDATLGITYPCSFSNLFVKMCNHLNVPYRTSTFINSAATISARPEEFDRATMRDVLQWLAEAAASVARFDRDGYLIFDWLRTTSRSIDENGYSDFSPYWYQTKRITKLCNRASNGEYESNAGSGNETYLIQDNPLLRGVT